ncbi:MAG TPA: 3-keto-5-aminohexanoate cleavage protein [Sedimentisphaerales bacterium]|nr:3-keto-5-aminohexanoate cleavage protein [Sedimentisphaerales bacterium]
MRRRVIIAVAPVKHPGSDMPAGCRNPQSADDVAQEVIACTRAGAAMVHLHVRDAYGRQTAEMDVFARTLDLIRAESDIIIQGSTGGLSSLSLEERCVSLNDPRVEVASLNMGSCNFGNDVYINTLPDIRYWANRMQETETMPELEVFDLSMIGTCNRIADDGLVSRPMHFNICLGFESAIQATPENLYVMQAALPDGSTWGVTHDGMKDFRILSAALGLGASAVRVGFEDSFYYGPETTAANNVELVSKVRALVEAVGLEPMTPKEARRALDLRSISA